MKHFIITLLIVGSLILTGCSFNAAATYDPPKKSPTEPAATLTPSPETPTVTPTLVPTATLTPTETLTASPTPLPSPTMTPTWITFKAGKVVVPILLYHHVSGVQSTNRYYVTSQTFQQQLEALTSWGYTSVTVSTIANVLTKGGQLPARPVVISFDDGNEDIYLNAFPIMQKLGFVGTFYIVGKYLDTPSMVSSKELKEMIAAGWEIGSHSMSHLDLTKMHDKLLYEEATSKSTLEKALGIKIKTFAYPFGTTDPYVAQKLQDYGYTSAVGLGGSYNQSLSTLFYLGRIEVQNDYDMTKFASLLPWHDPPNP